MKPTEFFIEYDKSDPTQVGKPHYFNPDHFCDIVEQMVASDELIRALKMLDNPPAYYRMYPTERMIQLKKDLMSKAASLLYYINSTPETYERALKHENSVNPDRNWKCIGEMIDAPFTQPRAEIIINLVKELNAQNQAPFIVEFGPSNYWLPHGLHMKGLKFGYYSESLHREASEDAQTRLRDKGVWQPLEVRKLVEGKEQPIIFVCFETLEHLWREEDILAAYHRYQVDADYILLSTPCCTLEGGLPDYNRTIEHIRSYTPNEVLNLLFKWWPDYQWNFVLSQMMVFKGAKLPK